MGTLLNISDRIVPELANDNGLTAGLTYLIANGGLKFNYRLQCSLFICNEINDKYDKIGFEDKTSGLLNRYFENHTPSDVNVNVNSGSDKLTFSVLSMSSIKELDPEPPDIISWIIGSISGTIFLLVIWCIVYYFDVIKREIDKRKTIFIRNPMVITIGIGFYKENPNADDIRNIGGRLKNLDGIRVDLKNVVNLFGNDTLRYEIYPQRYYAENINNYKAYWNEQELIDFLKMKADDLETNLHFQDKTSSKRYDGLLVIISCHGLERCILTSDYKKIETAAIHRIFSGKKPLSRTIPRLFLFDCCSGTGDRDTDWRAQSYDEDDEEISSSEDDDKKGIKI